VRRAPFKLVQSNQVSSYETVECLRELLKEAESGELIGIAWVSMYRRRVWDRRSCGEAHRNPAWTLGMIQAYSVKLADEINDQ
jgi:hypothetical protein